MASQPWVKEQGKILQPRRGGVRDFFRQKHTEGRTRLLRIVPDVAPYGARRINLFRASFSHGFAVGYMTTPALRAGGRKSNTQGQVARATGLYSIHPRVFLRVYSVTSVPVVKSFLGMNLGTYRFSIPTKDEPRTYRTGPRYIISSPRSRRRHLAHGEPAMGQGVGEDSPAPEGRRQGFLQAKTYRGSYSTPCFFRKANTSS
jgi:hypothetical protein